LTGFMQDMGGPHAASRRTISIAFSRIDIFLFCQRSGSHNLLCSV
jgi:hypothetical protein